MTPEEFLRKMPDMFRARFVAQCSFGDVCWVWTGYLSRKGYGQFSLDGKKWRPHRLAYECVVGKIPEGLTLDHVKTRGCTSRACVRPDHLEPVSVRVNVLRGSGLCVANLAKTHCCRGHELSGENVFYSPAGSRKRRCRACSALWARAVYRTRRAKAGLVG